MDPKRKLYLSILRWNTLFSLWLIKSRGLSAAKRTVNRHHMLAYDPRRGSVAPINTFNFKRKLLGHRPHTHIHMHRGAEQKGGDVGGSFLGVGVVVLALADWQGFTRSC